MFHLDHNNNNIINNNLCDDDYDVCAKMAANIVIFYASW